MANTFPAKTVPIALALQGGGSHGAYTWGALEALLRQSDIQIEGISGTSAGAMNACLLAMGHLEGGPDGARKRLHDFWHDVSKTMTWSMPWEKMLGGWELEGSPAFWWMDMWSRMASPYQFNPVNYNPLRPIIEAHLDFEALASSEAIRLFISTVNVRTGKVRVFENAELSPSVLLASACLPFLFQAVTIEGEEYWDGGYAGNPSLFPLIKHCKAHDIVIIQNNPVCREELPVQSRDILNRMHEISFNTSLMLEMSMIQHLNALVAQCPDQKKYREIHLHLVDGEETLKGLGTSSKFNADWTFLKHLHALGDEAATSWYRQHGQQLGKRSTGEALAQYQIH